ncbi:uncharacterized protein [Centruroides vittatus]|uniref:uncharacterized protein isoform X2 n=1 Tax=Centruroides vittatus TaxID=120091 RepID=UPI00350EE65E
MNRFNRKEEFTCTKVDTGQIEHIRETTLLHDLTPNKELVKNNTGNSPLMGLHSLFVQNLNITEIFAPTKSNRKDLDYKSAETFKISSVLQCENNVSNPKAIKFKNKFPSASSEMVSLARTSSLRRSKSTTDKCLIRNEDKTDRSVAETPSVQGFICPNYLHKGTKIRENTHKDKDKCLGRLDSDIINELKDHSDKDFLKDIVAYVEVRSGRENRSKVVENLLRQMGAQISPRIRKSTTHVIFKEGKKSTRDIAVAKGIHLVSVLWVESCRQRKCRVPESEYPANIPEVYDSPLFCKKFQKTNYMQPKDFNVKFARSLERFEKILTRAQKNNERFKTEGSFIESEACCSTKECAWCDANNQDVNCLKCRLFYSLPKEIKTNSQNTELNNEEDKKNEEQKNKTSKRRRKLFSELNGPPKWITHSPDVSEKNCDVFLTSEKVNEARLPSARRNEMDESDKFEESPFVKTSQYSRCSLDDFIIIRNKRKLCTKEKPKISKCIPKKQSGDAKLADDSVSSRSLVLTSFQQRDQETLISIVETLGGFCIIPQVSNTTTHIVCADNRRTLNVLFGIVRGCWLLSSDWVFKSMESGCWLNEEPYELSETFPGARVNRIQIASKGAAYRSDLFRHLGNIFVSAYCVPAYNKLTELITLAGGKIITSFQKCQTVVGPMKHCDGSKNGNILHIKEKWILDCISQHKVLPYDGYKYECSPH